MANDLGSCQRRGCATSARVMALALVAYPLRTGQALRWLTLMLPSASCRNDSGQPPTVVEILVNCHEVDGDAVAQSDEQ